MSNKLFYVLLQEYINVFGKAPTIREMSMITDVSIGGVIYHINKLESLGKIERDKNKLSRKIIIKEKI